MTVVSSWSFGPFKLDITFNQRINADIASLDNGGYVVSLQGPVSTLLLFIDKNGNSSTAVLSGATNADVTQRADGNVVVAYEKGGETFTQVRGLTGASVVAETPLGGAGSRDPSVSKCDASSFTKFNELAPGVFEGDVFISFSIAGVPQPNIVVTNDFHHDHWSKLACLVGGGYAVVWLRDVPGESGAPDGVELWRAVYNTDGSVRSGPAVASGVLNADQILNPALIQISGIELVPTEDGGFIAKHQGAPLGFSTGTYQVHTYTFDSNGNKTGSSIGNTSYDEFGVAMDTFKSSPPASGPTVVLPSDAYAVAITTDESGSPGLDVHLDLVDAATGQSLTGGPQAILTGVATGPNVTIAALGTAGGSGVALTYELNGAIVIGRSQLVCTTNGDGFDNTIIGGEHVDVIFGRRGNDHIECGANDDWVNAGLGDDFCDGGEGNGDTYDCTGIYGVTIDLDITLPQDTTGGGGGGSGSFGAGFAHAIGILSAGNGIDTILNFENIVGSREGDNLSGDEKVNNLKGMLGDDTIFGRAGNDVLEGGAGNDQLFGGDNEDLLLGGAGDDTLDGGASSILGDTASYAGTKGAVQVDLRIAGPQDTGGGGFDTLSGIENLIGTDGNDTLTGNNAARNELRGGNGKDTLFGDLGVDNLFGDAGIDYLFGGDSNDRLEGGTGRDFLTGGLGADQFHYVSQSHSGIGILSDWVMDFNSAQGDKINLTTVFGGTLSYIGDNEFTGTSGQLRVQEKDTFQHVHIDLNGDGASDMDIRVMNGGITGAGDFVL